MMMYVVGQLSRKWSKGEKLIKILPRDFLYDLS